MVAFFIVFIMIFRPDLSYRSTTSLVTIEIIALLIQFAPKSEIDEFEVSINIHIDNKSRYTLSFYHFIINSEVYNKCLCMQALCNLLTFAQKLKVGMVESPIYHNIITSISYIF